MTASEMPGVGDQAGGVRHWVLNEAPPEFRIAEVGVALPGVGDETIRLTLRAMKGEGLVESTGTGARRRGRVARRRRI